MKTFNVTLTKIESTHNNVRTNETTGHTLALPEVGKNFFMTAPPLESGGVRMINTTEIKEVEIHSETEFTFKTQNSTYKVQVLGTEIIE
jgi:hypothetical protein